ncbi:hypothetical protein F4781DRAFT_427328 [Annulohypoxylon bovei var. microspora]|nr:hypothetical protein F4781DRAFT_427328 [Annulohypoxylon bovei var. microspora]
MSLVSIAGLASRLILLQGIDQGYTCAQTGFRSGELSNRHTLSVSLRTGLREADYVRYGKRREVGLALTSPDFGAYPQ